MIPSHAARLQSMLRSMTEVIIPALNRDDQLAHDQAQILLGNLRLLSDQADRTYEYDMVELREYVALLKELTRIVQGGRQTTARKEAALGTLAEAEPIAALPIPEHQLLAARLTGVKAAVDALISAIYADGEPTCRKAAVAVVLSQAASQNRRERAWFRSAGFDSALNEVPSLDEVLSVTSANSGSPKTR
ncbi:MAG: hypothetical protein ABW034_19660 [Steroidobacteraceae bacterium]